MVRITERGGANSVLNFRRARMSGKRRVKSNGPSIAVYHGSRCIRATAYGEKTKSGYTKEQAFTLCYDFALAYCRKHWLMTFKISDPVRDVFNKLYPSKTL